MKLWKISQTVNNNYDTYDAVIVAAETEEDARLTPPDKYMGDPSTWTSRYSSWCKPEDIKVEYIGTTERDILGVILASFNAG